MLALAGGRPLHEAVMMMIPEAWQRNTELPEWKRAFYECARGRARPRGACRLH